MTFDGIIDGDSLTVTATGVFEDKNAGEGKTVSITGLTLGGASAGNYVLAEGGQQTETTANITPKDVTVEITANGGVYGAVTEATAALVGVVDGDTVPVPLTYTGAANDGTEYSDTKAPSLAGSYTVTASITDGNYNLTGSVTADFVVDRADPAFSVSPEQADKTYGDTAFDLVPERKGNGEVSYKSDNEQVATVDENGTVTLHNAGEATITVTLAQTDNYKGGEITVTVHVGQAKDTLTVEKLTYDVVYGDGDITLSASAASGKGVTYTSSNPDVAVVDANGVVRIVGAGEAIITVETDGSGNYSPVSQTVVIRVSPKEITVTAEDKSKTYGEDDPKLTYTASGVLSGDDLNLKLSRTSGDDVGGYEITADLTGANPNYRIDFVPGTLTIQQKDIAGAVVDLGAALIENGETQTQEIQSVTVQNSRGETLEVTYTVTDNTGVKAGAYTMTIHGAGNFTGTVTKTFVIAPATGSDVETNPDGGVEIGSGSIGLSVQQEPGAPAVKVETGKAAIIEMLVEHGGLTAEELAQAADGADIDIILKVTDISSTISAESRAQIEKAAAGYTIGRYIDISLYKQITLNGQTGDLIPITGAYGSVTISVEVPKELLNTDEAVTRTFWIIRNHEGQVDFLPATYDADTNMLTFTTDRFSDYAIVYKDSKRVTDDDSSMPDKDDNGSNPSGTDKDNSGSGPLNTATGTTPQTGDDTRLWLWMLLLLLSCGGITATVWCGRQKKRTK